MNATSDPASRQPGAAGPLTVAQAVERIGSWDDLTSTKRRDLISAVTGLAKVAGMPAAATVLDPLHSIALLERLTPSALGVAPGTLANRRTRVRFALRRLGILAPQRAKTAPSLAPVWEPLLARLPKGPDFARLRPFASFCSTEGIAPADVRRATLDAYADRRAAERGGGKARDHARRVANQWNRASREIDGWPATNIGLTGRSLEYSPPFSAYPASLQGDIEAYLTGIGASSAEEGLYASERSQRPVSAATVNTRMYCLRRVLHGAVASGLPIETLDSLRKVTDPAFIKATLTWHHARNGGQVNADLGQLAATIASVANHLGVDDEARATIKPLLAKATPPPRTEITEQTARLLDSLSDPIKRAKLLHLPAHLMREAARLRDGWTDNRRRAHAPQPEEAAWLAATAVAIEILLHAPMRLGNLQHLMLGEELRLAPVGAGRWRGTIFVAADAVKNKRRIEVPLHTDTIALIRQYLDGFRPSLPGASSAWLFPGKTETGPRHKGAFGQAITEAVWQYVGVRLNPHAFRAFAGSIILEVNPHAIDDVRAVLGHASFNTALIYYRRSSQRAAAERLSGALTRERKATALQGAAHFMTADLRRSRGARR